MLSLQTVFPDTLELLKNLMNQPLFNEMRLVGGTSLALQYGHRRSVDLDFFGTTTEDVEEVTENSNRAQRDLILLCHCFLFIRLATPTAPVGQTRRHRWQPTHLVPVIWG